MANDMTVDEKLDFIMEMLEDQGSDLMNIRENQEEIIEKLVNLSTEGDGYEPF